MRSTHFVALFVPHFVGYALSNRFVGAAVSGTRAYWPMKNTPEIPEGPLLQVVVQRYQNAMLIKIVQDEVKTSLSRENMVLPGFPGVFSLVVRMTILLAPCLPRRSDDDRDEDRDNDCSTRIGTMIETRMSRGRDHAVPQTLCCRPHGSAAPPSYHCPDRCPDRRRSSSSSRSLS